MKYILSASVDMPAGTTPFPIVASPSSAISDAENRLRQVVFHLLRAREQAEGLIRNPATRAHGLVGLAQQLRNTIQKTQDKAHRTTELVMSVRGKPEAFPGGIRTAINKIQSLEGETRGLQNALAKLADTARYKTSGALGQVSPGAFATAVASGAAAPSTAAPSTFFADVASIVSRIAPTITQLVAPKPPPTPSTPVTFAATVASAAAASPVSAQPSIPTWAYVAGGGALLVGLIFLMKR